MLKVIPCFLMLSGARGVAALILLATVLLILMEFEEPVPDRLLPAEPDPAVPVLVRGVVLHNGQPVAGAVVSFLPLGDPGRRGAFGTTGPDGSLHLTTFNLDDGVLPGVYKVLIRKETCEPSPGTVPVSSVTESPEAYWQTHARAFLTLQTYRSMLPAIYGDVGQTPIRCKVPQEAPIVFDLQDGSRKAIAAVSGDRISE